MQKFLFASLIAIVVCVSATTGQAQDKTQEQKTGQTQDKVQADRWHGLVLGEATPAQAIEKLGAPKKDMPAVSVRILKIGDWVGSAITKNKLHCQMWEKTEGMLAIALCYVENKLAVIQLGPQVEIRAQALDAIYGVRFSHQISNAKRELENSLSGANDPAYQRDRGETFSNRYGSSYHVAARAEKSFIVADIEVPVSESLKRDFGAGTDSVRPGKVFILQIIDRKFENRDGESVLK